MVSALDSGLSAVSFNTGQGHCVVSLSKTLNSHSAYSPSRRINVYWKTVRATWQKMLEWVTCDWHPIQGSSDTRVLAWLLYTLRTAPFLLHLNSNMKSALESPYITCILFGYPEMKPVFLGYHDSLSLLLSQTNIPLSVQDRGFYQSKGECFFFYWLFCCWDNDCGCNQPARQ